MSRALDSGKIVGLFLEPEKAFDHDILHKKCMRYGWVHYISCSKVIYRVVFNILLSQVTHT